MTTGTNNYEHSDSEPARDKLGRFQAGASGNPMGRPRKQPSGPWSLQEALRTAFSEEVAVGGGASQKRTMPLLDIYIHTLVRGATKASAKDQLLMLERMQKLGVFDMHYPDGLEDQFTEADRRLIEIVNRELVHCCKCGGVKDDRSHSEK